jgi:outer membrane usher protein FimD/PapC
LPETSAGLNRTIIFLVFFIFLPYKTVFSGEQAVLKLILNEQDKGEFFFVLATEGDIWMARSDFEQLGLKEELGKDVQFNGMTHVSMKSVSGLEYRINEEKVSLDVTASPSLFREHDIDSSYTKPYDVVITGDSSAFLNYSVGYDYVEEESIVNISGELGISSANYLGVTTYTYQKTEDTEKASRLMTSFLYSDRDKLQTFTLGDFSSSSGALGSVILLGGISYSKNFSLAPFFLKQPPLKLGGTIETPSDVEIYLDGTSVRKEKLSPGEFTFQNIPATTGFGTASMVIKDVYGREKIVAIPYYYSERLLKKGLHEYSYNAGFIRKDFGVKDFSYGKPAFMSFHNFGFSKSLKIGYAAEASSDLVNIGPSVSFSALNKGIVNAAFAFSNNSGESGFSGMLDYIYQSRNFNVGLSLRSDSREYSNLTVKPSDDKAKFRFTGTIGYGSKKIGYLGVTYSHAEMYQQNRLSRVAVSYNKTLTKSTSLFATASKTQDIETYDEFFFGIHVYLGRHTSGSVNYTKKDDGDIQRVSIQKSLPPGDGFGYRADMVNTNDTDYANGAVSYQNSYGLYEIDVTGSERNMDYSASVAGGIGYIDKSVFLSRPITDSFAKVKVDKVEDVRVYYYGNEVGRTDKKGELIVTNIRSHHDNKIGIESQDIPIDYSITSLSRYISPSLRNGAVVDFEINRIQAIIGNLYIIRDDVRIPVEFTRLFVQVKDVIFEGLVGRNGEFYLENLPPGRHSARTVFNGDEFRFDIIIPESTEMFLQLGDINCEEQR